MDAITSSEFYLCSMRFSLEARWRGHSVGKENGRWDYHVCVSTYITNFCRGLSNTRSAKCCNKPCNFFQPVPSFKDENESLVSFDRSVFWGLNSRFVGLLRTIGERFTFRILIKGNLSPSFSILRSTRQGHPFSIASNPHQLIICYDQNDLVYAYADDITVVTISSDKIEHKRELFEAIVSVPGARPNVPKIVALEIGWTTITTSISVPWLRAVERQRLPGILFFNNIRDDISHYWDIVIQHISALHTPIVLGTGRIRVPLLQPRITTETRNLHISGSTTQVLLINQYRAESSCLKFSEPHITGAGNPPDLATIPAICFCLRTVISSLQSCHQSSSKRPLLRHFVGRF
uniref:Uncharacterized protein n=1 Tax=Anopheles christyi TaxID=43041 RepID=A0A182JUZ4_9DIPT